jgi:hypothetical protein
MYERISQATFFFFKGEFVRMYHDQKITRRFSIKNHGRQQQQQKKTNPPTLFSPKLGFYPTTIITLVFSNEGQNIFV